MFTPPTCFPKRLVITYVLSPAMRVERFCQSHSKKLTLCNRWSMTEESVVAWNWMASSNWPHGMCMKFFRMMKRLISDWNNRDYISDNDWGCIVRIVKLIASCSIRLIVILIDSRTNHAAPEGAMYIGMGTSLAPLTHITYADTHRGTCLVLWASVSVL